MLDPRPFITVHTDIEHHPKVAALSDKAFRALVTGWGWCARYTTDGVVGAATWKHRTTPKVRRELLDAGLVHEAGHDCVRCAQPEREAVVFHDYLQHQSSAEQIETRREERSVAGARGNHQRWHVATGRRDPACEFCAQRPDPGRGSRNGTTSESQQRSQQRSPEGSLQRSGTRSHQGSLNDRSAIAEVEVEPEEP